MPEQTLPKIVCLPSRWGVGANVMKNCKGKREHDSTLPISPRAMHMVSKQTLVRVLGLQKGGRKSSRGMKNNYWNELHHLSAEQNRNAPTTGSELKSPTIPLKLKLLQQS
eukprot:scaffold58631_cov15-Tisochrysis_lutea.AAC.1